jgi:hypothetical protein
MTRTLYDEERRTDELLIQIAERSIKRQTPAQRSAIPHQLAGSPHSRSARTTAFLLRFPTEG